MPTALSYEADEVFVPDQPFARRFAARCLRIYLSQSNEESIFRVIFIFRPAHLFVFRSI